MTIPDALSRLTAGLDRDEAIARAAGGVRWAYDGDEPWGAHEGEVYVPDAPADGYENVTRGNEEGTIPGVQLEDGRHIARQDPKATLLRVEAIRELIRLRDAAEAKADESQARLAAIPGAQPINPRLIQQAATDIGEFKAYEIALQALAGIYTEEDQT